jgi:hypothetical protein
MAYFGSYHEATAQRHTRDGFRLSFLYTSYTYVVHWYNARIESTSELT